MADVRDYFAITATRRGSSPESRVVRVTARRSKLQIHRRKCILVVQKEHRAISERDLFMPPLLSETDLSCEAYYSRTREHYYGLYSFLDISSIVQKLAHLNL